MKKVKLILVCVIFMLTGLHLRSQSDTLKKASRQKHTFEAGFNLYSLTIRPGNFYTNYKAIIDQQVFSGLYLKYHIGLNALRWELNYSQRNLRFNNGSYGKYTRGGTPIKS